LNQKRKTYISVTVRFLDLFGRWVHDLLFTAAVGETERRGRARSLFLFLFYFFPFLFVGRGPTGRIALVRLRLEVVSRFCPTSFSSPSDFFEWHFWNRLEEEK
jgi:hypothetical protein